MRWLTVALIVLAAAGCAPRADWIEGTLVTVDVSGVWRGALVPVRAGAGPFGIAAEMEMTLTQRGAKVTGKGRLRATNLTLEGSVRGDVLSVSEPGGRVRAEATVAGDEMSGRGLWGPSFGEFTFKLSRAP